ncbi:hypothetical protein K443DRAFT_439078 [Laccaria amethystina LaAM-08-1]|uniref:Uncharacterized protein n=1 Tax=Laccaria amethystina LaAM-08-1 TaxID=1095629 RepID=A0A0C9X3S4_9AGAR|nr:hypothetical protein K443DRAFT_439078 [Laccaria amethystina LaAM-08-1]
MRRRDSTKGDISVRLTEDDVDGNGLARLMLVSSAPVDEDSTIAPWPDVPVRLHPYRKLINLIFFYSQHLHQNRHHSPPLDYPQRHLWPPSYHYDKAARPAFFAEIALPNRRRVILP